MRLGAACPAPSRFGWKLVYRDSSSMLQMTTKAEGNGWPPLAAGFFGGSIEVQCNGARTNRVRDANSTVVARC
jgi:hypothetical protein